MFYFIGIKGTGMSALAIVMKNLGYDVLGSDVERHFFTEDGLIKNKILVKVYNEDNVTEGMTIIRGLSIKSDNVELKKAISLGLEIIDYNVMLGRLSREFKSICVAGCHGKTTTSALISHIFLNTLGCNYLVGDGSGYAKEGNDYFVIESCEYKRHFLEYTPYYSVVLNIDLDHVDYFKDIDDVTLAYEEFIQKTDKMAILNGDSELIRKIKIEKEVKYFGFNENNNIYAKEISYLKDGTRFKVVIDNQEMGEFFIPMYGEHSVVDALAAITVCYYAGIKLDDVRLYLKTFRGAKRRFNEIIVGDNVVIDDYAHHPNEVRATLNAVRQKYPDKQIITIFQPHTFSRTNEFYRELQEIFCKVDKAYVMEIHPAREKQEDYPGITSKLIVDGIDNGYLLGIDEANILNESDNAVFLFMSPNDISKLENDLIKLKQEK